MCLVIATSVQHFRLWLCVLCQRASFFSDEIIFHYIIGTFGQRSSGEKKEKKKRDEPASMFTTPTLVYRLNT